MIGGESCGWTRNIPNSVLHSDWRRSFCTALQVNKAKLIVDARSDNNSDNKAHIAFCCDQWVYNAHYLTIKNVLDAKNLNQEIRNLLLVILLVQVLHGTSAVVHWKKRQKETCRCWHQKVCCTSSHPHFKSLRSYFSFLLGDSISTVPWYHLFSLI